jgi:hypothetical protein
MSLSVDGTPVSGNQNVAPQSTITKAKDEIDIRSVALGSVSSPSGDKVIVKMPPAAGEHPVLQELPQNIKADDKAKAIPLRQRGPAAEAITTAMRSHAQKVLTSGQKLSPGREVLLREMEKSPGQLAQDITRRTLVVSEHPFPREKYVDVSKGYMYILTGRNIEDLVKAKNPALLENAKKVMNEIMYVTVQQSLTTVFGAMRDSIQNPLEMPVWAPLGEANLTASYDMQGSVLAITNSGSITMMHIEDEEIPNKKCSYQTTIKYDLATNDVTFTCRYSVDGKGKEWSVETPFVHVPKER